MSQKFDKVKLSRHQQRNLDDRVPGHDISAEDAAKMIANPIHTEAQADGRERYYGEVRGKTYSTIVSAAASATATLILSIGRVVTSHRRKLPKGRA